MARGANLARMAGTGLLVVAGIGVLAWVWLAVRGLGLFGDSFDLFEDVPEVDLDYRLDAIASHVVVLVNSVLAAGLGVALRLAADYTVARTGGSLTGVRAGEPLPSVRRWPPAEAET